MTDIGVYSYCALRIDGAVERGTVTAVAESDANARRSARGLVPLELRFELLPRERRMTISVADLALGLGMLADLLDAGLPVARTLQAFDELAPAGWQPALPHIRQAVKE